MAEYGAYNAYSISLLTMPSFFIAAVATSLLPEVSKFYTDGNMIMVKRRIKQALLFAFVIGLGFSIFIFLFRDPLLFSLYKTTIGSKYIKILAPIFVLFYLEGVLTSSLQAMGYAKTTMKISLYGVLIKLIFLSILSLCHIGIYSLVISEIINILFVVYLNFKCLNQKLKFN